MPSFRSRLFVFALKHRHLLKFQLRRRSNVDWNTSMVDLREEVERGAAFFGKLPEDLKLVPAMAGDLPVEWMMPEGAAKDRIILYFHGGGYTVGSIKAHRRIVAKVVEGSGTGALVFDYRLAPENPFPAALDDALAAYRYILEEGVDPSRTIFMGDSAGGGLVLAALLALKERGMPLPAGAVVLSPWTDLKKSGDSWTSNAERDTLCWREAQTVFSRYYAGDNDPGLPLISPLYGDLRGLPPLLMYVGGDELLLDDSTRFAGKAKEAGVDVILHVGEGMFHCYPACSPLFPEARNAMSEICAFIKHHCNGLGG